MKDVLVTGGYGQLGFCFQKQSEFFPDFNFRFLNSAELDITSKNQLKKLFSEKNIDYCINCAAYTNVEAAEDEVQKALEINAEAARNLAEVCREYKSVLIHFSTDYVFNGKSQQPYQEEDEVNPINVYGASKLKGEEYIQNILKDHFIFRTSWLYSEYGHNFLNTILKKAAEGAELNITDAQLGTPTNANDLAYYVLKVIESGSNKFGIYHFSNRGEATWYDFAKEIITNTASTEKVILNKTGFYKTKAARPEYSVLSKNKADLNFGFPIEEWKKSLKNLIEEF